MTFRIKMTVLMILSPIFIIFQVIDAFSSFGLKGCMPMIEMGKITHEIRQTQFPVSLSSVQLFMFEVCMYKGGPLHRDL
jgi:hypothetical protein